MSGPALAKQALALLTTLNAEGDNADQLGDASIEAFCTQIARHVATTPQLT